MAVNFKYKLKEIIPPQESLIRVDVKRLQSGIALPFNVYIKEGGALKKIFNRGNILNPIFIEILERKGLDAVYVDHTDLKTLEYCLKTVSPKAKRAESLEVAFSNYSFKKEKHFQVDRRLIVAGTKVNFPIFHLKGLEFKRLIDASLSAPALVESSILDLEGELVILEKDIPLYHEYLKSLEEQIEKEEIPEEDKQTLRNIIFKENTKIIIKDILNDPRSGDNIKKLNTHVDGLIEKILNEPEAIHDLLTLKGYDFYTYTHSINVGVLSIGLGATVKLDRDILHKLAIGSILHDIGKTQIPHIVLNKQGKLNEVEYRTIKQHVLLGYNLVCENKEIPRESLTALLQHHEKLSGKGYPYGLKDNEIELFGRITAIADCYDALTTRRPYKAPLTPYMALCIIANEKGDYDRNLLVEFIKMLGNVR